MGILSKALLPQQEAGPSQQLPESPETSQVPLIERVDKGKKVDKKTAKRSKPKAKSSQPGRVLRRK